MVDRKVPEIGSQESIAFCQQWDAGTHDEKLFLCRHIGIAYSTGRDYRSECKAMDLPPEFKEPNSKSWGEHIETIKAMDDIIAYHQRVPTEVSIVIPTDKPIGMIYTADWHLGQFGVDYDSFEYDMDTIEKTDGVYCEVGGDGYQNVIQPSKIGSSHNQTPIPVQKALYVLTLKKLKNKVKVVRTGNHNYWTTMAEGEDWDGELAKRLKLLYLKHFGKVYYKIGDMVYPELALHKSRFNSSFNITHSCKQNQRMYFPEARMVISEHTHIGGVEQYRYNENECLAIHPGTYAVYDDYAQQNGYFGSHVCNPMVILFPEQDKMISFKDMHEGIEYLKFLRGDN